MRYAAGSFENIEIRTLRLTVKAQRDFREGVIESPAWPARFLLPDAKMAMKYRPAFAKMTIALAICALSTAADVPATRPSASAKGIKEQLIKWQKTIPTMDIDAVMRIYHSESDAEAAFARVMADWNLAECKLQKAVCEKWGSAVESAFAHLNGTDTLEDDQNSTVEIDGNNAVVSFQTTKIQPCPMIFMDGQWQIDIHSIYQKLGKDAADTAKYNRDMIPLFNDAAKDIASAKYSNGAAFLRDFQEKLDNLDVDAH
jgi:hypothetical protein